MASRMPFWGRGDQEPVFLPVNNRKADILQPVQTGSVRDSERRHAWSAHVEVERVLPCLSHLEEESFAVGLQYLRSTRLEEHFVDPCAEVDRLPAGVRDPELLRARDEPSTRCP